MINYFRQLTLPWLVALCMMLLCTGVWYHYESKVIQRDLVQQFALALHVSIKPLLQNNDQQLLNAQLNHLRFASVIPVTAIALYDAKGQVVGATEEASVLHQLDVPAPVNRFRIESFGAAIVAIQPVTASALDSSAEALNISSQHDELYLLILMEPKTDHSIWLFPLLITAASGFAVIFFISGGFSRSFQRLQTDISLISHKLSQLKQGQVNSRLQEDLVPELLPLQQTLNELAEQLARNAQQEQAASSQYQKQCQQANADQQQAIQQAEQCRQVLKHLQLQHSAHQQQLELLLSQAAETLPEEFANDLGTYSSIYKLLLNQQSADLQSVTLCDSIAPLVSRYADRLAFRGISFDLQEASDNAKYRLKLSETLLLDLVDALLQTGMQFPAVTEVSLSLTVSSQTAGSQLYIKLGADGDGLSPAAVQFLTSDNGDSYWPQLPLQLLKLVAIKLQASIEVQSLQGVGSAIAINLPVKEVDTVPLTLTEHVLLFDVQKSRLVQHKTQLSALCKQVTACSDLAELALKLQQQHWDRVVLFLPPPEQLSLWLELLPCVTPQRLLCYAAPQAAVMWREALHLPVHQSPFMLAHWYAGAAAVAGVRLLVVDDNQTNLAFIQILLKDQPVQLTTASSGAEALTLCKQQQFELILLDIQLPDMHGTEVASQLRAQSGYTSLPILAFTAHALSEEVESFLAAGMNDVIFKPLDATKLQQILRWCSRIKQNNIS